jgi:hypothetical protein
MNRPTDAPIAPRIEPFALEQPLALIEAMFPVQKVSFEAQCERKAGAGQTRAALGSYWKGRKRSWNGRTSWPACITPGCWYPVNRCDAWLYEGSL